MDIPKVSQSKSYDVDDFPVSAYSRSLNGPNPGMSTSFNRYSMSPRSTSVMFQYYSTPKGYYKSPRPRSGIASFDRSNVVNTPHMQRYDRSLVRTISDSCGDIQEKQPVASGIPQTIQRDVLEDPRRRAWSESDKKGFSSMNSSRMSALRKLRKKLSRSGSQKKKDDATGSRPVSQSRLSSDASISNLEEGKPLILHSPTETPKSPFPFPLNDDVRSGFSNLSLYEEDETNSTPQTKPPSPQSNEEVPLSPVSNLIYQRFLEEHTCYDIMPTSCKLIVFDTRLQASKAFHALLSNCVRSAPLWDSTASCYVGMLTVTDFINMIITCHRSPNLQMDFLEEESLEAWRQTLGKQSNFMNVQPHHSLLHSLRILTNEHFHGVPVLDSTSGDIFHVVNHKRILRFLHLFMNELPIPDFMHQTLKEAGVGTYKDVCTIYRNQSLLEVLEVISEQKLTAIPVIDENDEVVDVFCKLDIIPLAAQSLYRELNMTLDVALQSRYTPLFEDEALPTNQYPRYSSPKPTRRELRRTKSPDASTPPNSRGRHNDNPIVYSSSPQRAAQSPPVVHEPLRHSRSITNPLVKCKLSDKLKTIIDRLVATEANLLVVVTECSNHVVGVVTASDVLCYITHPQSNAAESKPTPPVPNLSSESITINMAHDSGYTSSSSTIKCADEENNPVTSFFNDGAHSDGQRSVYNSLWAGAKIQRA
ncbi:uncharacterized protein LOC100186700 [Ciona intestinalis]